MHAESILSPLNTDQREAVKAVGETVLVYAGAGTGKTRVLTRRFAWLVDKGHATPEQILAVTFTNRAAGEMYRRVQGLLHVSMPKRECWIGTIHSVAKRILKSHPQVVDLPPRFDVIGKVESVETLKSIIGSLEQDPEEAKKVYDFISIYKEMGEHPPDSFFGKVFSRYNSQLREESKVDFGDLMNLSYRLLENHPQIRMEYAEQFRHVLVDEFQDINSFQYKWLSMFKRKNNNLFVVGDDDQAIYGFRGTDPQIMRDLRKKSEEVFFLAMNYRSQPRILRAANALIKRNHNGSEKMLRPTIMEEAPLQLWRQIDDQSEAESVAREVRNLQANGSSLESIGVIYRTNVQSRLFEESLTKLGLPYQVYGGQRYSERKEVRVATAYLRLALDQNNVSAFRCVASFQKISPHELETIEGNPSGSWEGVVSLATRNKAANDLKLIIDQLATACKEGKPPSAMVKHMLNLTRLREHYQRLGAHDRVENLDELENVARQYEQETGKGMELEGYLSKLRVDVEYIGAPQAKGVSLMTAHAAKGLEFETVFVAGLEENYFPHYYALEESEVAPTTTISLTYPKSFPNRRPVEEERRLMYVAITRAKRKLYLSYAQRRRIKGKMHDRKVSPFISELPRELFVHNSFRGHSGRRSGILLTPRVVRDSRKPPPSEDKDSSTTSSRNHSVRRGITLTRRRVRSGDTR